MLLGEREPIELRFLDIINYLGWYSLVKNIFQLSRFFTDKKSPLQLERIQRIRGKEILEVPLLLQPRLSQLGFEPVLNFHLNWQSSKSGLRQREPS